MPASKTVIDRKLPAREKPTPKQAFAYQQMYDHFNRVLFDGKLPAAFLNFSRKAQTLGFFAPKRWQDEAGGEVLHEISLNPAYLLEREPKDVASTLVHEMVHLWQAELGKPSRRGYHNHEWADQMEAVGLMPSDTGEPGGARVGQRMTHYVMEGGPFERAFARLPEEAQLPWRCVEIETRKQKRQREQKNKTKYTCPGCDVNVWGKPDLSLLCGDCGETFEPA